MNASRLADCLAHIRQAADEACSFVRGMDRVVWETVLTALPDLLPRLPAAPPVSGS